MTGSDTAMAHLRRAYGIAKIEWTVDVVTSCHSFSVVKPSPVLIFNTYHLTGDKLENRLVDEGISVGRIDGSTSDLERKRVISAIQTNSIEAAILQVDAAGSALDLQTANRVIMLEPSWAPGTNKQAVARAVRVGQKNPVLVSWPYIEKSLDQYVLQRLREKREGMTGLWGIAS
jgi:SNF2 family DNA or RNA helicase